MFCTNNLTKKYKGYNTCKQSTLVITRSRGLAKLALNKIAAWTIRKADQKRLEAFQMRCLRATLNISWQDKVRNEEVWRRAASAGGNPPELITSRIHEIQWPQSENEKQLTPKMHPT